MSWDEAVAEANAAAPPDAPILKIRARAVDSILGSASFGTTDAASARRWPFLFEPLLRYGPRAALAADRLQRELTTKLAKASERFDRPDHRGAVPRATATKAPRVDAFDPSQNPGAPGAPRPLGSLAPAAKGPVQSF